MSNNKKFKKRNKTMKFKVGDKVIIDNTDEQSADLIDTQWMNNSTILKITEYRDNMTYEYECVDSSGNKSIVLGSWLKHASVSKRSRRKHPENAITRVEALKLAKQLHPKVTHIALNLYSNWTALEGVKSLGNESYHSPSKSSTAYHTITVPIRYYGTWQDSIYPKVYFSPPLSIEGFEHDITVKEDGSLTVGCNEIPSIVVDQIIAHRTAELKNFPNAKKKAPAKKKAATKKKASNK